MDINAMITELYNKLILKEVKAEKKPRKMSMREYFIHCYVKEGIYQDLTPFTMIRGSINDIPNLAAQITFKMLPLEQKQAIETEYKRLTEEELQHLKDM